MHVSIHLVFLIFLLLCIHSSCIVFRVNPVSIAAVDGTTVEFTCTANNSVGLSFRVNGSAVSQTVINRGFQQQPVAYAEELGNMVLRRNLIVTVSSLYNNTEIHCEADGSPMDVDSKVAVLTVQGLRGLKYFKPLVFFIVKC